MPWEGLNPLEYGASIIAEACLAHEQHRGFSIRHPLLGRGTRTTSFASIQVINRTPFSGLSEVESHVTVEKIKRLM